MVTYWSPPKSSLGIGTLFAPSIHSNIWAVDSTVFTHVVVVLHSMISQ